MLSSTDAIIIPAELEQERMSTLDQAKAFIITTPDAYALAADFGTTIKALRKKIKEHYKPIIDAAKATYDAARAAFNEHDGPLEAAEAALKGKMSTFHAEEERKAEEARRKMEEELRKQAEEEQLNQAVELESMGLKVEAQEILNAPPAPVYTIPSLAPKPTSAVGVSHRENWSAEVFDLPALIRFVSTTPSMLGALKANDVFLNNMARAQKQAMVIPGVRAVNRPVVSMRAK